MKRLFPFIIESSNIIDIFIKTEKSSIVFELFTEQRYIIFKAGFARNPKAGIQNSEFRVRMETRNSKKGEQLRWRITQWRVVLRHNLLSIQA